MEILIKRRGADVEKYDFAELPPAIHDELAARGAKSILQSAPDPAAAWERLKSGKVHADRTGERSTWRMAALAVKTKMLKKEGSADPAGDAEKWWSDLTAEGHAVVKRVPAVIIEHAKITGKELPSI